METFVYDSESLNLHERQEKNRFNSWFCALKHIFSDLVGPTSAESKAVEKHFVTLLEEHSVYPIVRFIGKKSMARSVIVEMIA